MKNKYLKYAVILGTISLVWSIVTLNIFGIVGVIMSWVCYSNNSRNLSLAALIMYIISAVGSVFFGMTSGLIVGFIEMLFGNDGSIVSGLISFINTFAFLSIPATVLYVAAAVFTGRGRKALADMNAPDNGFFD